jgi:hypothetical protein
MHMLMTQCCVLVLFWMDCVGPLNSCSSLHHSYQSCHHKASHNHHNTITWLFCPSQHSKLPAQSITQHHTTITMPSQNYFVTQASHYHPQELYCPSQQSKLPLHRLLISKFSYLCPFLNFFYIQFDAFSIPF